MKPITLILTQKDAGQIRDGLEQRQMAWERTAAYLDGGCIEGDIEECSDLHEARKLSAEYARLVRYIDACLSVGV